MIVGEAAAPPCAAWRHGGRGRARPRQPPVLAPHWRPCRSAGRSPTPPPPRRSRCERAPVRPPSPVCR
eukprot:6025665-Pyramimonas_sp.AAC.2